MSSLTAMGLVTAAAPNPITSSYNHLRAAISKISGRVSDASQLNDRLNKWALTLPRYVMQQVPQRDYCRPKEILPGQHSSDYQWYSNWFPEILESKSKVQGWFLRCSDQLYRRARLKSHSDEGKLRKSTGQIRHIERFYRKVEGCIQQRHVYETREGILAK
jgi:hypothetical protein